MMNIRVLEDKPQNKETWTEYVNRHPEATLDHCWEWRWVLEGAFGYQSYYLGAFESDRLTGILPLFHVQRGLGRSALVSIPFGNYGGICADTSEAALALLEETKYLMGSLKCSHVGFHHKKPVGSGELQSVDERARFSLPLENSLDHIFSGLKKTIRKKIRYGEKNGVTVRSLRDTGPLYKIHTVKFRELGTPCFPRAYFDLTLKYFGERTFINYAYFKDEIIAFNLIHFFQKSMLVTVGGDLKQYLYLHPNVYLAWDQIKMAVQRDLSEYDMCRSRRDSGAARFKLFLGMKQSSLGYQYLVSDQQKLSPRNPDDPKFRLASRLWRNMPLGCTKVLGPKIVRYLA